MIYLKIKAKEYRKQHRQNKYKEDKLKRKEYIKQKKPFQQCVEKN